jgi:hypothetical protein
MISGIVVNKKVYKEFEKLPLKGYTKRTPSGIPYFPLNSVPIYVRPYIKVIKICYDSESLRKELGK